MSVNISGWEESYVNHDSWETIAGVISELEVVESTHPDLTTHLIRVQATLRLILEWREMPSLLVSDQMLTSLGEAVRNNIKRHIQQWDRQKNVAHLNNVVESFPNVLDVARGWPQSKDRYAKGLITTMQEVGRQAESTLQSLQDDVEAEKADFHKQLEEVIANIVNRDATANQTLQSLTTQVTQTQQTLDQLLARATEIDKRVDSVMTTQQNTFTTAESQRQKINLDHLDKRNSEFEKAIEKAVSDSETRLEGQADSGNEILNRIRELEKQALKATVSTAGARTSKDYKTYAEEQRHQADRLRTLAIVLFVAAFTAGASGWIVSEVRQDFAWSTALLKATLTFTLIAAAGYTIKESSNHRKKEEDAKSAQLRLEALEPFISNLGPKDIRVLRMAAAQDLFIMKDRQHFDLDDMEEGDGGAVV